eukprot:CAMPEP_0197245784 /NCGR_PEP_ID=MMETSP1429-20130617/10464_1 /TAXON_ID=49237 /ORGANISM="Chaetoceros  sp., Strain UNC1202" /LENGTH=101 /DNA_ID=CAMNT_0042706339 /DNA_START=152 /DNA_END=455 /DNA_ORIENTATION=-
MTKLAIFDVGGTKYKVSRSLLEMHPGTLFSKNASENWQKDPESDIFIERTGIRFQYVLDYLRDGKAAITESKETFVAELGYYGIEMDQDKIDDSHAKLMVS